MMGVQRVPAGAKPTAAPRRAYPTVRRGSQSR